MICYILFVLNILVSVTNGATAAYDPTEIFFINCGATYNTVDGGRTWTSEEHKLMASNILNASFSSNVLYKDVVDYQIPYMEARIFQSEFTYSVPLSPGLKFLRLYFYPTRYISGFDAVNSFFSVTVNGFTLLKNFSPDLTIRTSKTGIKSNLKVHIREFIVPVNQSLNLTFTPSPNSVAFVNGIEIVSMPDRFYSKGGFDDVITNVVSTVDFEIDNTTAFETIHRLNVAGQDVILKMSDFDSNLAGPNPNPTPKSVTQDIRKGKGKSHVVVITLTVIGLAIGLVTFIVILKLLMRQMKRKKNRKENSVIMFKVLLKQYTYAEVKRITKSFSHIVGKGGFGTVYGGSLSNDRKVAVKVLKDLKGNGEDFINEVASMSQTSHANIVSLLGFCNEGSKRAIIYEFLENGSLDQFISRKKPLTLDVTTLYAIALGIARGLEYLHYGCKTRIVHLDIKPQNILLDGNLCPKVSDFGLAKLCEKRESIMSLIDARGTIGYIAPEVFSRMYGGISHKSDVYSYGMLVLEMIGARNKEIIETTASNASSTYFPDWVYKDLENGQQQTWRLGDEITKEEKEIAKKMVLVSLWCIQPCPTDRPSMNKVVEMIEGSLDDLEVPPKPSMHISTRFIPESSSLTSLSNGEEDGENSNL
ncbi:LOW QUALITY PROTEIN: probable receptor-like protein kinase At5g39020 [Eutrema salsugineum]|uniref:LOW QUALITY PROTEIN: probable receptor-like protein kinase At5g39020 n=1 Tax=Eutrema salsugineum TaxID=72664 RepID=UPI000CED7003|nr:LOW QUALITY PROTEIN: probable receptor-like protein kinase At5g39020 [Eutrema salsugineum]